MERPPSIGREGRDYRETSTQSEEFKIEGSEIGGDGTCGTGGQ